MWVLLSRPQGIGSAMYARRFSDFRGEPSSGIMKERFSSNLGMGLRGFSWPTLLLGIVIIKAVLSLALKPGSFLLSYSGISYFLLLLLATGFAIRNGIQKYPGKPAVLDVSRDCLWSLVAGPGPISVLRTGPAHRGARQFDCRYCAVSTSRTRDGCDSDVSTPQWL